MLREYRSRAGQSTPCWSIKLTDRKFYLVVGAALGVFILLVAGQSSNTPAAPENVRPAQQAQQQQPKAQAQPKAQEQAQASDPFAGKPWRQWSEDEMTEFMRRALIACVKKADPKQEHDCYGVVNTIADDWKAHHG
jgi:hypothetical protein